MSFHISLHNRCYMISKLWCSIKPFSCSCLFFERPSYTEILEMLLHVCILFSLDNWNSLLNCLSKSGLFCLSAIQNATARLLTRTHKWPHITPVLSKAHWLPLEFKTQFTILVLTLRALHEQAPWYISDLLQLYSTGRVLRSAHQAHVSIPRTRLKTCGDRACQSQPVEYSSARVVCCWVSCIV